MMSGVGVELGAGGVVGVLVAAGGEVLVGVDGADVGVFVGVFELEVGVLVLVGVGVAVGPVGVLDGV